MAQSGATRNASTAGECLTAALIVATIAALLLLTACWRELPWPLRTAAAAYLLTLYGSLQHEVIHGHPTPSRRFNHALVWLPFSLWLPLPVYAESHRAHHRAELTRPGVDPESWYVDAARWQRVHGVQRWLLMANQCLAGRLLLGPWIAAARLWSTLLPDAVNNARSRRIVFAHAAGVGMLLAWTTLACDMPVTTYLLGFAWPGAALSMLRAFAEHRHHHDAAARTAIVRAGWGLRLAFLNNNYHYVHHARPGLAWYRIPSAWRADAARIEAENQGFSFDGYGDIARRYLLRPWTSPAYPG